MAKQEITAKGNEHELGILDGLRGLMALWVLVGHTCQYSAFKSVPIIRSAHYPVIGFMLLSGFLMTYHYIYRAPKEPWQQWRTWTTFYIRRFFRIAPVYYLLLIPAYLLAANYERWSLTTCSLLGVPSFRAASAPISLQHLFYHLTFIFGLLPQYHASLILPDWSLSLEMQFYAAFPFLMLIFLYFGWTALLLLCGGSFLLASSHSIGLMNLFMQPSPLPLGILWFVIGMLWAWIYLEKSARQNYWIALSLFLSLLSRDLNAILVTWTICWILFAHKGMALFGLADRIRQPLSGRIAHFAAEASYCVYLIHLLLLIPISYFIATHTHLSAPVRFFACLLPTIVLTYAIAVCIRPLEKWGIRTGKLLVKHLGAADRSVAPPVA